MDKQEYLGVVAILEGLRASIQDASDGASSEARLKRVLADLDKAIQAYRDKANAARS